MANDKRVPDLKPVSLSSANIARKSYKMAYEDVSRRHSSNIYADLTLDTDKITAIEKAIVLNRH